MNPKDVIDVPTMSEFNHIKDSLNLTDRQKEIFDLKYHRGFRNIDIAEDLQIHQDTVGAELKVIREKLKKFSLDKASET